MKSKREELEKRGFVDSSVTSIYNDFPLEELYEKLNSKTATNRTKAVLALRLKCNSNDEKYVRSLLKRLAVEKSLYTKIEICKSLEKGSQDVVAIICEYLGKIGNNQHKSIPSIVSKKKSYPLPRDIIARTIGKMEKSVYPILLKQLIKTKDIQVLSELIDAIGYMTFHNPQLATDSNLKKLYKTYESFKDNELIVWRITLCCSAFPTDESEKLLCQIQETTSSKTIYDETKRSLRLLTFMKRDFK